MIKIPYFAHQNTRKWLIITTTIAFILALFYNAVFYKCGMIYAGHDAAFHLCRLRTAYEAFSGGVFPNYFDWYIFNGYGYATHLFYPDLLYLVFAPFVGLLGIMETYKLMLVAYFVLCAAVSYISVQKVYHNVFLSVMFALVYTFSTYHLTDVAARAAFAEFLAFIWCPLVFWGAYEVLFGNFRKRWYVLALGMTLLTLTHLISAMLAGVALVIVYAVYVKRLIVEPKRILYTVFAAGLSVLLMSYWLLPFLEQISDIRFQFQTILFVPDIYNYTVDIRRLFWGLFSRIANNGNTINFRDTGLMLTLLLSLRIFIKRDGLVKIADRFALTGAVILVLIALTPLWKVLDKTPFAYIQFPWRLLICVSFLWALAGTLYLSKFVERCAKLRTAQTVALATVCLLVTGEVLYLKWQQTGNQSPYYEQTWGKLVNDWYYYDDYMSAKTYHHSNPGSLLVRAKDSIRIVSFPTADNQTASTPSISGLNTNRGVIDFTLHSDKPVRAELPLLYYKGYAGECNGEPLVIAESEHGLVEAYIPQAGNVHICYQSTPVQKAGRGISLVTLFGLITIRIFHSMRRKGTRDD